MISANLCIQLNLRGNVELYLIFLAIFSSRKVLLQSSYMKRSYIYFSIIYENEFCTACRGTNSSYASRVHRNIRQRNCNRITQFTSTNSTNAMRVECRWSPKILRRETCTGNISVTKETTATNMTISTNLSENNKIEGKCANLTTK